MVHTAELTYFPNSEFIKSFRTLNGSVWYTQDKVWYNGLLKDYGLQFRLKMIEHPDFRSPRMICRVNFSKLLHPADKISIITPWDIDEAENRFNDLTRDLLPFFPEFQFWKVNRIDYCVNVHTPYVDEYIHLLKKGNRRYMQDWYDRNGNYTQKPGSLYYVATAKRKRNRGVTVNFYNKIDEMMKSFESNGEWPDDERMDELPRDILRLEVQCHKAKVDYLQKKYGLPDRSVMYFLDHRIAYEMISTYLKIIAGESDYHRKSVALEMIDQTGCRQATKEKMKNIIQDVAKQHSSIWKVRDAYVQNGIMQRDEYNALMRMLHSHNINPVTITNNLHLEGLTLKQGLKSVFSIFEDTFEKETIKEG